MNPSRYSPGKARTRARQARRQERRQGCPGHIRHWFSLYGWPGVHTPCCVRCDTPNPRPLNEQDWAYLAHIRDKSSRRLTSGIIRALAEHDKEAQP